MPTSTSGVYTITCATTNTVYVGSSKNLGARKIRHFYALRQNKHHNSHLQRAWNKYGNSAFSWSVVESCQVEDLVKREEHWTRLIAASGAKMYNAMPAADGKPGFTHNAASRLKMSAASRNRIITPETRRKLSLAQLGKPQPQLWKAIVKDWPDIVAPDGTPYRAVRNLQDFCTQHSLDVSTMRKVLLGKKPHYRGWRLLAPGEQPIAFTGKVREYGATHTITAPDGTIYRDVTNLEAFCREHKLSPSCMRDVAVGRYFHYKGWKAVRDGYEPVSQPYDRTTREWPPFIAPDGSAHQVDNLYKFCKQHGLDKAAMQRVASGKSKSHKGWHLS